MMKKLKRRAARRARSAQEKQGPIVSGDVQHKHPRPSFKELLSQMPDVGDDSDFERHADLGREIDL